MARRNVPFLPNQYYHIYNRGAHRMDIFRDDADYLFLLKLIKEQAQRCNIAIIAYCLMCNHYHFLLRQNGEIQVSRFMQAVFNVYTKTFNSRHAHSGTLFEGPFWAIYVDRTEYLWHLCRYIHRNPLESGLVTNPDQWIYSNYLEFIGERNGVLVDRELIKINFCTPEEYRGFVLDYVPPEKTQKELRHYLFWD